MAAVTTNGQLFVWGDGKYGQLGLGSRVKQSTRPYLISSLRMSPIKMVTCGRMHTVVGKSTKEREEKRREEKRERELVIWFFFLV